MVCKKCNIDKPIERFSLSKRHTNGRLLTCMDCENEKKKKWALKNPDKIKLASLKKRIKRKEADKILRKEYKISHREQIKEYNQKWREDNKDRTRETRRAWEKNNPEKVWLKNHKRRLALKKTKNPATSEQINQLITDSNNKCFWCDCDIPKGKMQIDHITPISKNGDNSIFNLVISCATCNIKKSDKSPEVWLEEILQEVL